MSYFLIRDIVEKNEEIEISGAEARHILLSRRINIGEEIEIQDSKENRFLAEIISLDKNTVRVKIKKQIAAPAEPETQISIFQAMIKEQALDNIIQKATELGVKNLFLFSSENSVIKPSNINGKIMRWQKITEEAAKQSGRLRPISITIIDDQIKLTDYLASQEIVFLLFKNDVEIKFQNKKYKKIGILVGPEGGFSESEIKDFKKIENIFPKTLGPRTLRSDTAAIAGATIIGHLFGDIK